MQYARGIALIIAISWCFSAAGAEIRLHCQGEGPAVYLIGGGPAFTTWNLQPIQDSLSVDHRVCRWDMRGVGDNAGLSLQSEVSALSQWLQDMHDVLPPEPVVLWGHSWGALQVLLFTRAYPQRVRYLILSNPVDPGLHSLEGIEHKRYNHPDPQFGLALEDMGTSAEELYALRSKVASYFSDAEQGWQYAQGFTQKDSSNVLNVRIWDEYRDDPLTAADVRQLADKVSGAIYCRDDVLQPEGLNEYRRLLAPGKHHVLGGCAHFPWEENPGDYYRVLLSLIGGQRTSR